MGKVQNPWMMKEEKQALTEKSELVAKNCYWKQHSLKERDVNKNLYKQSLSSVTS